MPEHALSDRIRGIRRGDTPPALAGDLLSIAILCQDAATLQSASQLCQRAVRRADAGPVHYSFLNGPSLENPKLFAEGVEAAVMADLLILSAYSAAEWPADTCAWIDAWLPRRHQREGALVGLVRPSASSTGSNPAMRAYLQAVARKGHLDFFYFESPVAAECDCITWEQINERAQTITPFLASVLDASASPFDRPWS